MKAGASYAAAASNAASAPDYAASGPRGWQVGPGTHRTATIPGSYFLLVAAVVLALLLAGCASDATPKTMVHTTVSVDTVAHAATIHMSTDGDWSLIALFITDPSGHRELNLKGNVASGGGTLHTGQLPPGEYGYTVYWIPLGNKNAESVSADQIVENGQAVSGRFTVP